MNISPSEADIQRAIMAFLLAERIPAIRFNSGALRDSTGRPLFFARWMDGKPVSGLSDIVMLVNGRAVFVEIKAAKKKQRPSQVEFELWAKSSGCAYLLANSVDVVRDWLRERRGR